MTAVSRIRDRDDISRLVPVPASGAPPRRESRGARFMMRQLSAAVVALACVGPARASVYAAPQVSGAVPTTPADASTASVAGAARVPAAPAAFVENNRL